MKDHIYKVYECVGGVSLYRREIEASSYEEASEKFFASAPPSKSRLGVRVNGPGYRNTFFFAYRPNMYKVDRYKKESGPTLSSIVGGGPQKGYRARSMAQKLKCICCGDTATRGVLAEPPDVDMFEQIMFEEVSLCDGCDVPYPWTRG